MYSLFKNLLADKDIEVWAQVIIIAVIIGFSILKAIARSIKTMSQKLKEQNETPLFQQAVSKKYKSADTYKTLEQLREERIAQIRAAFGIPEPPVEQETVPAEAPPVVEKIEKPPALSIPEMQKVHAAKTKAHTHDAVPTEKTIYKLLFSSPGDLRKAVLYQEILGKPLAMRDSA